MYRSVLLKNSQNVWKNDRGYKSKTFRTSFKEGGPNSTPPNNIRQIHVAGTWTCMQKYHWQVCSCNIGIHIILYFHVHLCSGALLITFWYCLGFSFVCNWMRESKMDICLWYSHGCSRQLQLVQPRVSKFYTVLTGGLQLQSFTNPPNTHRKRSLFKTIPISPPTPTAISVNKISILFVT